MSLRISRKNVPVMMIATMAILLVAAAGILLDARHALHTLWNYCSKMLFLFNSGMPLRTILLVSISFLFITGILYSVIGFVIDRIRALLFERMSINNSTKMTDRLYVTRGLDYSAWTTGILKTKVFLSEDSVSELNAEELNALIEHEMAHIRNRDVLKRTLMDIVRRLFFFIPSISEMVSHLRFAQEVRADKEAISRTSTKALCGVYLSGLNKKFQAGVGAGFAFNSKRLSEVLDGANPVIDFSFKKLMISFVMILIMIFASVSSIQVREAHASAGDSMSCDVLQSQEQVNITPLVGNIELYTPMR